MWTHLFITITLKSTLTLCGSACWNPISGSNRSIWKSLILDRNTWNQITAKNWPWHKISQQPRVDMPLTNQPTNQSIFISLSCILSLISLSLTHPFFSLFYWIFKLLYRQTFWRPANILRIPSERSWFWPECLGLYYLVQNRLIFL